MKSYEQLIKEMDSISKDFECYSAGDWVKCSAIQLEKLDVVKTSILDGYEGVEYFIVCMTDVPVGLVPVVLLPTNAEVYVHDESSGTKHTYSLKDFATQQLSDTYTEGSYRTDDLEGVAITIIHNGFIWKNVMFHGMFGLAQLDVPEVVIPHSYTIFRNPRYPFPGEIKV